MHVWHCHSIETFNFCEVIKTHSIATNFGEIQFAPVIPPPCACDTYDIVPLHPRVRNIISHVLSCESGRFRKSTTLRYLTHIQSGFHRTCATGVACRQGTLTPPDTWSRPFGTCICSTCWGRSFSELVVILPDYALLISLGTFSILLNVITYALFFSSWIIGCQIGI